MKTALFSPRFLRWITAEFIGTFFLTCLAGTSAVGVVLYSDYQALFIPLVLGLTLATLVYGLGKISSAHFNPAVTLAALLAGLVSPGQAVAYLVGQLAGAFVGVGAVSLLTASMPPVPADFGSQAMLGEFLGVLLLSFTVLRFLQGHIAEAVGGVAIGSALAVGSTLALGTSGGLINPAIALALGGYHPAYLLAPLLGGVAAAGLAVWLERGE